MAYNLQTELNYLNAQLKTDFRRLVDARNAFYSELEKEKAPEPVKVQEPVKKETKTKKVTKEDDAA